MANRTGWRPFRLSESLVQRELEQLAESKKALDIRDELKRDSSRVSALSLELPGLYLDMSKQRWDEETRQGLVRLAEEADVSGAIADLFSGVRLNTTEDRAVLHMALRAEPEDGFQVDGRDVMPEVLEVRSRMLGFVDRVHRRF